MTSIDRNPLNITDPAIRCLSQFLFQCYHSTAAGRHSHVSDALAATLAEDQDKAMELVNMIARTIEPDFKGEVIGFFIKPEKSKSLLEALLGNINESAAEGELITRLGVNPLALWSRAAIILACGGYTDGDSWVFSRAGVNE